MKHFKLLLIALLCAGILSLAFYGCKKDAQSPILTSDAKGGVSIGAYDALTLSCAGNNTQTSIALTVTAGASGAPAGFTIQWMTYDAYVANGSVWPDFDALTGNFCKASFSGVPYGAKNTAQAGINSYNLSTGGSVTVYIGDLLNDELNQQLGLSTTACNDGLLTCGTQYVFRAFAHADSKKTRSVYTIFLDECATTSPCGDCNHQGFGYWKQHPELITALTLGDHDYTADEIFSILNQTPNGNGLVVLAHQLIAAKLNGICADRTISADAIFNGKVVPPVGSSSVTPASVAGMVATLNKHNNGCLDCSVE